MSWLINIQLRKRHILIKKLRLFNCLAGRQIPCGFVNNNTTRLQNLYVTPLHELNISKGDTCK
jgi:hypothetical protein